jgi:hypothetical protein
VVEADAPFPLQAKTLWARARFAVSSMQIME